MSQAETAKFTMEEHDRALVDSFLNHLRLERRLSENTIKSYRRDLDCLLNYCERQRIARWADLDHIHVRQFAATSFAGGLSSRSIQRRLSGVRSLLNYLIREDYLTVNPANDVAAPKGSKRLPETLDADQMAQLLNIKGKTPADLRDKAMLELMYSSGLRLAELTGLDIGDIDLEEDISEYGFDSILLTKLSNILNETYELDLRPTVFYNYPTINKISDFLYLKIHNADSTDTNIFQK